MVEVVVALMLLMIMALATFGVLDSSTRASYRAEQNQSLNSVAQRELEALRDQSYRRLALKSAPGAAADSADPRSRVAGSTFDLQDGSAPVELVIDSGNGAVEPGPTPFVVGDISGQIYRFVVWQPDDEVNLAACGQISGEVCQVSDLDLCPGEVVSGVCYIAKFKRAVVIVSPDDNAITQDVPYQELQSDVTDPSDGALPGGDPPNAPGAGVTAQQLWLSDTPCVAGTSDPTRVAPSEHFTHDTLGSCGGTQSPDALLTSPPEDPAPEDPNNPLLYDYASDIEPAAAASPDAGLQMLAQPDADPAGTNDDCNSQTAGENAQRQIHWWSTRERPLLSPDYELTGKATLELYTRTIDDVSTSGGMCIYLFKRSVNIRGEVVRYKISLLTATTNTNNFPCATTAGTGTVGEFARCTASPWPRGGWEPVRVTVTFNPDLEVNQLPDDDPGGPNRLAIGQFPTGSRLELGISVTPDSAADASGSNALQFAYDHPDVRSRLELQQERTP